MRLIGLAVVLILGLILVPPTLEAQQAVRTYRIAVLVAGPAAEFPPINAVFKQGLSEHGYVEGKNLVLEVRFATTPEQLAQDAEALVRLNPALRRLPLLLRLPRTQPRRSPSSSAPLVIRLPSGSWPVSRDRAETSRG